MKVTLHKCPSVCLSICKNLICPSFFIEHPSSFILHRTSFILHFETFKLFSLFYFIFKYFRFKDFASEVRGNMDVESLLDDAAVLLDLTETSLERIIHTILNKTLEILDAPMAYEEAMSTLFLPESGNILAKTIQV